MAGSKVWLPDGYRRAGAAAMLLCMGGNRAAVMAMKTPVRRDPMTCLNDRERAIAFAAAHGAPQADIASWLGVSEFEVGFHLNRACHKLGMSASELRSRLRHPAYSRVA
ncbi:MAG: hypothetical protein ACRD0U_17315 [Acidimicrobiales bacterium]